MSEKIQHGAIVLLIAGLWGISLIPWTPADSIQSRADSARIDLELVHLRLKSVQSMDRLNACSSAKDALHYAQQAFETINADPHTALTDSVQAMRRTSALLVINAGPKCGRETVSKTTRTLAVEVLAAS